MSWLRGLMIGVVAGLSAIAGFAWWLGYFADTPDEVSIEAAAAATAELSGTTESITDLTGSWHVVDDGTSFVGYRINEVLTTLGDFTVVGRTDAVIGTIEGDGMTITAVNLVADMTSITTDNSRRDEAMRDQALETGQFPEAGFVLSSPIDIAAIPATNETIAITATGDLTIHGVTQEVAFPLTVAVQASTLIIVGQLDISLADYDIAAPSAPVVASVEDTAILELSLVFEHLDP